jgi:hypothetical protein
VIQAALSRVIQTLQLLANCSSVHIKIKHLGDLSHHCDKLQHEISLVSAAAASGPAADHERLRMAADALDTLVAAVEAWNVRGALFFPFFLVLVLVLVWFGLFSV